MEGITGSVVGRALARPFLFALYLLSGVIPRDRDLWVFGSWGGHRYADNAAAFFAHCSRRSDLDQRLVWISRDLAVVKRLRAEGHEAHLAWSPRGIWRAVRAEVFLFDCFSKDINFWLSKGATKVNLWSGVPLKVFERDIDVRDNRYYRLFHGKPWERLLYGAMMPWHLVRPDMLIATSETTAAITRRAFDVDDEAVVVTGFPRNDAMIRVAAGSPPLPLVEGVHSPIISAYRAGETTFLYLPTFRDSAKPFLTIDWDRLHALMEELNARFFIKFHPVDATAFEHETDRIVQLYQDTDVYDILPFTTALISDYSSVIFDYMLLDRPIVYFVPDLQEFATSSRSLLFDPSEIAVGPLCTDLDELLAALGTVASDRAAPIDPEHRASVTVMLHSHSDDKSCDRVMDALQFLIRR
ncbi:MAG: CDP-glycerol glycerophosphotransferase family protein [Acidimicrobiia bacterium]|nr:CDP-glycerol glycerophosphotransferase family protein [Acidimicrobiia bacterium]